MFTVGLDVDSRAYFSAATAVISIPTAVKVFSYLATWTSGRGPRGSSITYAFWSFLICFTAGGFTGLILSSVPNRLSVGRIGTETDNNI
jgi:heme/copper-type cytochrome/quinol oxidase subunit 1